MSGHSFNRVRIAALKSLAAMQDRLENYVTATTASTKVNVGCGSERAGPLRSLQ
jgi:hypothetical protein